MIVSLFIFLKPNNQEDYTVDASDYIVAHSQVSSTPIQTLTEKEKIDLIKMREEEKLAYDVYTTLYKKWGINIFRNIAASEKTHTDSIRYLIERYKLTDPVKEELVGVYSDDEFKKLFNELTAKGNESLVSALTIGATIEDLDIKDLQDSLNNTDNQDIINIYQNLSRGSRNHMRAFTKQLTKQGVSYQANYLTQKEVDDIINSPQEKGN